MNQDQIFLENEGNRWFSRNKSCFQEEANFDYPSHLIDWLLKNNQFKPANFLELGCSNGWRLESLRKKIDNLQGKFVGLDASQEAIENGKIRYPELNLHQGLLSNVPIQGNFDVVIVNFVLHWVDRKSLAQSVAEVDRLTKDGGILILGDFLPDFQQRRHYHHRPSDAIYTYKQDYAKIFESLGLYKELARLTFNHDRPELGIHTCDSSVRGVCVALQKSLLGFYPEV